jgi:hypothetical protein
VTIQSDLNSWTWVLIDIPPPTETAKLEAYYFGDSEKAVTAAQQAATILVGALPLIARFWPRPHHRCPNSAKRFNRLIQFGFESLLRLPAIDGRNK